MPSLFLSSQPLVSFVTLVFAMSKSGKKKQILPLDDNCKYFLEVFTRNFHPDRQLDMSLVVRYVSPNVRSTAYPGPDPNSAMQSSLVIPVPGSPDRRAVPTSPEARKTLWLETSVAMFLLLLIEARIGVGELPELRTRAHMVSHASCSFIVVKLRINSTRALSPQPS